MFRNVLHPDARRVRRDRVIVGEPRGNLVEHVGRCREVCTGDVVPAQRIHKRFGHPVRLGTRRWRRDRYQVEPLRGASGIEGRVDAPVVAQPALRSPGP